ncbi:MULTISPECIES: hypothetical protein [unclassified Streptomyces]|uniref:hypothetical protein n=1 Tax=unclassified Streptomyces TaxID=2593676 RepID=UPI0033BDF139
MNERTPSQAEGEPDTGTDTPGTGSSGATHDTGHTDPGLPTPSQAEGERDDDETAETADESGTS